MFVNFSNHPSTGWSREQRSRAELYGEIYDIAFPNVPEKAEFKEVCELAEKYADKIAAMNPECVLCQGEYNVTYAVVKKLRSIGIRTVTACSERIVEEYTEGEYETRKTTVFRFVQFRDYI